MIGRFQLSLALAAATTVLAGFTMSSSPASAWSPPSVGQACPGARGPGPQQVAIAGNYLGGRAIRDGIVDRKSFQACFHTLDRCEIWLADRARHFPLAPGIATCTPVVVR